MITEGFSEYMHFPWRDAKGRPRCQQMRGNNAVSALKHADFTSAEVSNLLAVGAVSDVTHLRHDLSEVAYILGLLVAERHG